jgi:hypothetical protein
MHKILSVAALARHLDVSTKLICALTNDVFVPFARSETNEAFFSLNDLEKLHNGLEAYFESDRGRFDFHVERTSKHVKWQRPRGVLISIEREFR